MEAVPLEAWAREYGSTGVKAWELTLGANDGVLVYFHELSVYDLGVVERIRAAEEAHPGTFDVERSAVSLALLSPPFEEFPDPAMAALELFPIVTQYGHGPLDEGDLQESGFAESQVADVVNARSAAYDVHASPGHTDLYLTLAQRLATDYTGAISVVDPVRLDRLLRLSPGRVRDLCAQLEQIHVALRQRDRAEFKAVKEAKRAKALDQLSARARFNPFDLLDHATDGASRPGGAPETVEEVAASVRLEEDDDYVPGTGPPRPENAAAFDDLDIDGPLSDPTPPSPGPSPAPTSLIDEVRGGAYDLGDEDGLPRTRR